MTARDSAHDTPRRHQSLSTSTRPMSTGKRSPSPIVTFTPTPLSSDPKGVKNITRKVIRTLEGLGHLESTNIDEQGCESDERYDASEVEDFFKGSVQKNCYDPSSSYRMKMRNGIIAKPPGQSAHPRNVIKETPKRIDWEIPRKLLHSSIGFFTVYLYISESEVKPVILVLWTALIVIAPADILRLRYPPFERIYERCLGFLMRESEKKSLNGVIWYILGVNFALTFYPLDVATVAILILSWADTTASFFGRLFGSRTSRLPPRTPILRLPLAPRKSLAGFLAATATGAFVAIAFWGWVAPLRHAGADSTWWWDGGVRVSSTLLPTLGFVGMGLHGAGGWVGLGAIGLFSGLTSGVAEALDLGSLDDNLTLPIISGGSILSFLKLLGLFSA